MRLNAISLDGSGKVHGVLTVQRPICSTTAPIIFTISVNPEYQRLRTVSKIPFIFSQISDVIKDQGSSSSSSSSSYDIPSSYMLSDEITVPIITNSLDPEVKTYPTYGLHTVSLPPCGFGVVASLNTNSIQKVTSSDLFYPISFDLWHPKITGFDIETNFHPSTFNYINVPKGQDGHLPFFPTGHPFTTCRIRNLAATLQLVENKDHQEDFADYKEDR
eukprot:UN04565